jgi:hypothetical protein
MLLRDFEARIAARFLQFPTLAEKVAGEMFSRLHVVFQLPAVVAPIQHARRHLATVPRFPVHHCPSAYSSTYRIAWYAQNDPTIRFAAIAA